MPDLVYIQDLIKLCRKNGITVIKLGDMELTLGAAPAPTRRAKSESVPPPEEREPTPEELLFFSVNEVPNL